MKIFLKRGLTPYSKRGKLLTWIDTINKRWRILNEELDSAYMKRVADAYKKTGTLQKAADALGIAYAKVRKILITIGEYETPFSKEVNDLRRQGLRTEEIAKKLGTNVNHVSSWLPYEKNIYNLPDRSPEAKRCENYRKRIEEAQRRLESSQYKKDKGQGGKTTMATANKNEKSGNTTTKYATPKEPIRLHCKLQSEFIDEESARILKAYGRSSSGLSIDRDIMVPSDMTLHSLHYALQKLYGWQNSHLRAFRLPEEIYEKLTGNTVRGWSSLIGILFQTVYPEHAWNERYGDDDYVSGSVKTWLRKKYTGPYGYVSYYEIFENAVKEFEGFADRLGSVDVYAPYSAGSDENKILRSAPIMGLTLQELNSSITIEEGTEDLLERLLIADVLAPAGQALASAWELNQGLVRRSYNVYGEVFEPKILPVTDRLLYHYDYGDGWIVEITRVEGYDDLHEKAALSIDEYIEARNTVIEKHKPVCLHQDGMFVLDDVGGLRGFIEMLKTLFEPCDQDTKDLRAWAGSMGWNTRKIGNKALL